MVPNPGPTAPNTSATGIIIKLTAKANFTISMAISMMANDRMIKLTVTAFTTIKMAQSMKGIEKTINRMDSV